MRPVCYQIDAADTLVSTDEAWFELAAQNEFAQPNVVGTSLWRHITDSTTARIYQNLLKRVRQTGEPVELSFRCDSPILRRFMFLKIIPTRDGGVKLHSVTSKTESRALINVLRASLPRSSDVLKICSWCNRIEVQGR